jgi:hypothetical protein
LLYWRSCIWLRISLIRIWICWCYSTGSRRFSLITHLFGADSLVRVLILRRWFCDALRWFDKRLWLGNQVILLRIAQRDMILILLLNLLLLLLRLLIYSYPNSTGSLRIYWCWFTPSCWCFDIRSIVVLNDRKVILFLQVALFTDNGLTWRSFRTQYPSWSLVVLLLLVLLSQHCIFSEWILTMRGLLCWKLEALLIFLLYRLKTYIDGSINQSKLRFVNLSLWRRYSSNLFFFSLFIYLLSNVLVKLLSLLLFYYIILLICLY